MTGLAKIFTRLIVALVFLVLVFSCAKQVMPTGGPRDQDAPKIVSSIPRNGETNYTENALSLEFDEYVVTNSLPKELIVSPPLSEEPKVKMQGKTVEISWKDTLVENTTYLFQFGAGIKDLNEGNILDSNVFVFSTGPKIDSLSKQGKVIDAFSLQPVAKAYVMLYRQNIDSLPKIQVPDYFTITDENGQFSFQYLAPGKYKAFALLPINKGYLYDLPSEKVAFSDTLIESTFLPDTVLPNFESAVFRLFLKNDTSQYIRQYSQIENKAITISFNKPVTQITVNALDGTDVHSWFEYWNAENDSVVFWFATAANYDSLKIEVVFDQIRDTLLFRKPKTAAAASKGKKSASPQGLKIEKTFGDNLILGYGALLQTPSPIDSLDLNQVMLYHAEDTINFGSFLEAQSFGFEMKYDFLEGETYDIYFPKGSVSDVYGLKNDSLHIKFSVLKDADLGEIVVHHQLPKDINYIWQLLDKNGNWVEGFNVSKTGTVTHKNLLPGTYQIRLMFDENANQYWDSGDYELKQQPERVVFYESLIEVRANWISEIDWIIGN